jgi:divalent metal cation (Fe/Co/Zn/Cd) transporter
VSPALVAAAMVTINAILMLRPALNALMDRAPTGDVSAIIAEAAARVPGVLAIEDLRVRASGLDFLVDAHVQAKPSLTLYEAHELSGRVKAAIRAAVPEVGGVLIHMEPFTALETGPKPK